MISPEVVYVPESESELDRAFTAAHGRAVADHLRGMTVRFPSVDALRAVAAPIADDSEPPTQRSDAFGAAQEEPFLLTRRIVRVLGIRMAPLY